MSCKNCGGSMIGDGVNSVMHCEYAGDNVDISYMAPDEGPVHCSKDVVGFVTKSNTVVNVFSEEDGSQLGTLNKERGDWYFYGRCTDDQQTNINNYTKNVLVK